MNEILEGRATKSEESKAEFFRNLEAIVLTAQDAWKEVIQ